MNKQHSLYAGYAERIITPPLGEKIPGYFSTRFAEGKITDLLVRATALNDGEKTVLIYSCDAISLETSAAETILPLIAERCGINRDDIYFHTTHTHTAFRIMLSNKDDDPIYADYYPFLVRMLCDTGFYAIQDLTPCTMKIARGKAEGISFNRRYELKDGTFKTNPPTGSPNILRSAGPVNDTLQLIRFVREGANEILFVNFGTHPDTINGCLYHYDWPGYTVDLLKSAFDGKVNAMVLNGAQGDVNHCNRFASPSEVYQGSPVALKMARVIAGEVLKIYDFAVPTPSGKISTYKNVVKIGQNTFDPATLPLATEIYKHYKEFLVTGEKDEFLKNPDNRRIPTEGNRTMTIPEAVRIINSKNMPEFFEVPITGLQIGRVGLIGIPGEPFTKIGTDIQAESKLDMTIVNCLVNGSFGYFPTADAFAVGGYERSTSKFAHNCAELVVSCGSEIIQKMNDNI